MSSPERSSLRLGEPLARIILFPVMSMFKFNDWPHHSEALFVHGYVQLPGAVLFHDFFDSVACKPFPSVTR